MKVPTKNKVKKQKMKKKPKDKNTKEQVLVIAQEFKFARLLSGNEKKTRDRVLKTLKKWLQNCFEKGYEFKEDDFIRVWKGLFYAVWMSDKPLVQEELCENIAEVLDLFSPQQLEHALLMTKAGFKVLATEWYGIDHHRMDKFLMLVRRYLRGSLRCLQRCDWSLPSCEAYTEMLMASDGILCVKTPKYARNAMSMILHFIDCYLEELAKVSGGVIPEQSVAALLQPLSALVCGGQALALCVAARRLLTALVRQSEPGLRYQDATRAWQKMGCPAGGPGALELVSDDEQEPEDGGDPEDDTAGALDPRAGRVDVLLPLLPVPAALLADQLRQLMAQASSKAYKRATVCLERLEALLKDEYTLVLSEAEAAGAESPMPKEEPRHAAQRLRALEKALVAQTDELALRGLKRKHRKRLLARSRAGLSIVEDAALLADCVPNATNGDWEIEETEPGADAQNKKIESFTKENEGNVKKKANRKRKAQENGIDKVKKAKISNNVDKNKGKSELSNGVDRDKNVTVSKSESLVNGNSDKGKGKKGKKIKDSKNHIKEKTTIQDTVAKSLPKLIETHKKINKMNAPDTKSRLTNGKENKKILDKMRDKKNVNLTKATEMNGGKLTKRQKVLPLGKVRNYQKQTAAGDTGKDALKKKVLDTPKKVKFVLKNNSMQRTVDYYKSVRQSPSIPFDSSKQPSKTNLKVSTPSPINPFFKKKMKAKF